MNALDPTGCLDALKRILADLPNMDGAPCIGRWELFDPRGADEPVSVAEQRHAQAAALCHQCEHITACAEFGAGERDVGQVRAGRLPAYGGRPTTKDTNR